MSKKKYPTELLRSIANNCTNVQQVLRELNCSLSGSMHAHISRRLREEGIDTSHFDPTKKAFHNFGPPRKKPLSEILIFTKRSSREKTMHLRRALLEIGVPYECYRGHKPFWMGEPLQLDVDHISGDWRDNRKENLRFICPNCHSQTNTWKNKTRKVLDA